MAKKKLRRRNPATHYFIIVGNGKPMPVVGKQKALTRAWELSEKTNKVVRVVRLVAKFKSGAKLNKFTLRPEMNRKKRRKGRR